MKTIVFASLWFVIFVISKIFAAISPILIAIVALLWLVYFSTMFVYIVLGIINAKNEIQKPLPINREFISYTIIYNFKRV